jgi:RNA methyltransferase, TrmH family
MPTSHRTGLVAAGSGHPRVRKFLDIKHNRGSHPPGALALEGLWSIRHAVRAGLQVEAVFVCPALLRGSESDLMVKQLRTKGAIALEVSERVLRRMVDRDGPDGLAALAVLPSRHLDDISVTPRARVVVADSFELAGNLGTVIRCADGAGVAGVIITERRLRLTHPLVVKASTGTVFSMPIVEAERADALDWLRRKGFRVVAADPASGLSYRKADYRGRIAIVLGSERYGLGSFWGDAADATVSIPMLGVADSLNVGHAAAVLLYEALHGGDAGD